MKLRKITNLLLAIIVSAFMLLGSSLLLTSCGGQAKPEIMANVDSCERCNMTISKVNQACGYFIEGEFITFDAPSCLLKNYDEMRFEGKALPERIYFADFKSAEFIPADKTHFLMTNHIPTVMNARVVCFSDKKSAETFVKHDDEVITDWMGYRVERGTPDKKIEIVVTEEGMQPDVVILNKNEIVEWSIKGEKLKEDISLKLKGYEDLGSFVVPADGEPVKLRMLAELPGAGFPFLKTGDETPIGMVKVIGAHTTDEEEM